MKKLLLVAAFGCAAALLPPKAMANSYFDVDSFFPGATVSSTTPVSTTFNFITGDSTPPPNQPGYNPAAEFVTSFDIQIVINGGGSGQNVHVDLDGVAIDVPFSTSVTIGASLFASQSAALIAAAQDGIVNMTLSTSDRNSFLAQTARMDITTAAAGVPDGGSTLALLGIAAFGLGFVKRKMAR